MKPKRPSDASITISSIKKVISELRKSPLIQPNELSWFESVLNEELDKHAVFVRHIYLIYNDSLVHTFYVRDKLRFWLAQKRGQDGKFSGSMVGTWYDEHGLVTRETPITFVGGYYCEWK